MLSSEELDRLSRLEPTDINPDNLVDIRTVHIDTDIPIENRMERYIEQIKNPYCYTHNGTVVKVVFSDDGQRLDEILVKHFSRLKNCGTMPDER